MESRTNYGGGAQGGYSRPYRGVDDLVGAFTADWDRSSFGGGGGGCCCGYGGGGGGGLGSLLSEGVLFGLLAAAALAFYVLYTAVTMAAAGRRRRSILGEAEGVGWEDTLWNGRFFFA